MKINQKLLYFILSMTLYSISMIIMFKYIDHFNNFIEDHPLMVYGAYFIVFLVISLYIVTKSYLQYKNRGQIIVPLDHDFSKGLYSSLLVIVLLFILIMILARPSILTLAYTFFILILMLAYYFRSRMALGFTEDRLVLEGGIFLLKSLLSYEYRENALYMTFGRKYSKLTFYRKVDFSLTYEKFKVIEAIIIKNEELS